MKSAYALGIKIRDQVNGADASPSSASNLNWKKIWKLNVANKVKVFVWQLAHNSLQVKMNIAKRGVILDTLCPVCHRFDEDTGHLLFKCKDMQLCWRLLNMEEVRTCLLSQASVKDMLEKVWNLQGDVQ